MPGRSIPTYAEIASFRESLIKTRKQLELDELEKLHGTLVRMEFDCLRANKSMMAWGVEARVPFLDRGFIDVAMSLDPEVKLSGKARGRIEKQFLREAFAGYLQGLGLAKGDRVNGGRAVLFAGEPGKIDIAWTDKAGSARYSFVDLTQRGTREVSSAAP